MTAVRVQCAQGTPCWVSLMARDLGTAETFYGALLGWEFESGPVRLGRYVRATLNGAPVAGLGVAPADLGFPVEWTTYFAADSTDGTAQRIRECGGTVAVGPLQADESGRLVIASDVSGAVFGVWEGQEHQGWQTVGVPGAPAWTELVTSDGDAAAAFYGSVFGPAVERSGDDAVLRVEGRAVAGIRGAAALRGGPPRWRIYFAVADADRAARRAVELGGRLLVEPQESPHGRVARLSDPEGGRFSVVQR
ncbi:VOC family protein [Peterkaempfera bronchialis]|uniref:VOC family protein n=1 Tax=Peterkaempfera bronchialis TaxID=2126346 RepID=A0A345T1G7_9ACTN|nr:VOC family protein [Peterkaempfera bronchialis]AXI79822.1 VOC family protein [Peterkaempfera bronchialis]